MSNGRLTQLLTYESYEAPMMLRAMRIAANTAFMCGHKDARARFQQMIDEIKPNVPACSKHFDEEAFGEMGAALQSAATYSAYWHKVGWKRDWDPEGYLVVRCDDRVWATRATNLRADGPELAALLGYLTEIAPLTAQFVPHTAEEVKA